jgi:hypothetical protein
MNTKKSLALQGLCNQIEDLVRDEDVSFQSSLGNMFILIAAGNKKAEVEEQARLDKDTIAALQKQLKETEERQLRATIEKLYNPPKPPKRSVLIEREETRRLNVKEQDAWRLQEDDKGVEYATLILKLIKYQTKSTATGTLYMNGISIEKLEELRTEIERYLAKQKPKVERMREEWRRNQQEMTQSGEVGEAPPY